MNSVELIGRLVRDPEVRYTPEGMAIAHFSVAVDREGKKEDKITDYPNIVAFGRVAETCEKYLKKGRQVGIQGRLQTGNYTNKKGEKVYTTEVAANRVDFMSETKAKPQQEEAEPKTQQEEFEEIDDDVPF